MFVNTDSGTEILCHEVITSDGGVELEPVILSKGQISELRFVECEEVK